VASFSQLEADRKVTNVFSTPFNPVVICGHVNTVCAVCCEREIFSFFCTRTVVGLCTGCVFLFLYFLCICVFVLYHLVVRAASVDGCLCLSGSLPLIFFLYACAYFEANKYDDDDDTI